MNEKSGAEQASEEYLARLQGELDSLERFPRSSYSQLLILCLSVPIFFASLAGFSLLPVAPYLILPFVVVPGWRLVRQEWLWQEKYRAMSQLIRVTEQRRSLLRTGGRV